MCAGEDDLGGFVAGVHAAHLDPAEVRHLGCVCPTDGVHDTDCPVLQ